MKVLSNIASTRKIASGVILLIAGLVVTYFKGDIPNNLLSLMQWLYTAFVMGNMAEYFTQYKKENKENKNG